MSKRELIAQENEDMLFADGFDEAIMGVAYSAGNPAVCCYDIQEMVDILVDQGMTAEEADEYLYYNVIGSYVGPHGPIYVEKRYE